MEDEKLQTTGTYILQLVRCALNGMRASPKPASISWQDVYAAARFNSIESIVFFALEASELPEDLYEKWKQSVDLALYKNLTFDLARTAILQEMAKAEFDYIELKGILLSEYYPKPGMRYMADNDILYRCGTDIVAAQQKLKAIMEKSGYICETLKGNHDIYKKEPFLNFEMHRVLVAEGTQYHSYYKDIWSKAVPMEGCHGAYGLKAEDVYLYTVVHSHKHYRSTGCGLRSLIDLFVFLKARQDRLDWNYIDNGLREMEIDSYEKQIRDAATALFSQDGVPTPEQQEFAVEMLGCGTYGTRRSLVQTGINNFSDSRFPRIQYVWHRIFLNKRQIQNNFPVFAKHRVLIPLLPIYRVIRSLRRTPGHIAGVLKTVLSYRR